MRVIATIALLVSPTIVSAHHSRSEYEFDELTELNGTVVSVSWRNPHIEFQLRDSVSGEQWHVEGNSAISMNAMGVQPESLRPSMSVRVAGGASVRRPRRMEMTNLLLPDGVEIVISASFEPLWSERVVGEAQLLEPSGALPDDGRGIFRVWTWEPVTQFWMIRLPDTYPLTDAARAAAAQWNEDDPQDNLILQCIGPGMPATMGNPHPIEFIELHEAIELRSQEFDLIRTIHMGASADPANVPPSPLGYSVGRWEGDTLVVTTTRLNAPYFNRQGVPQSELAQIDERFTVDAEAGRLDYVLTVTDPVNLTEPFVHELVWNWNENAYLQRYDCRV